MIHEEYVFNHLCHTYWLPLYSSTNQINKYNNNNNKGNVLALLCQGGNSIYHIYICKYIFVFFLPTLVLFWHGNKTKKSTISNQNQAPNMILWRNTIWCVSLKHTLNKYIFVFFLPTLVLFWHENKTKKKHHIKPESSSWHAFTEKYYLMCVLRIHIKQIYICFFPADPSSLWAWEQN